MYVSVVTGASKGIGEEFARQLAARQHNLLLVARSADRLGELSQELEDRNGIRAVPFACDLAQHGASEKVYAFLKSEGMHPTWLVNNAGFGLVGSHDSLDFERVRAMAMLNMVVLAELTHLLLPMLRLSRSAQIINVASTAAFQPVPYFALYAATKAFVLSFSDALHEELRNSDVNVLALCPGPTPTQFHVEGRLDPSLFDKGQTAAEVARMGIEAALARRAVCVTQARLRAAAPRFLPRFVVRRLAGFIARRMIAKGAVQE